MKNLSDYYPVYMDISDFIKKSPSGDKVEYPSIATNPSSEHQIGGSVSSKAPAVLNAEELTDLALKCGVPSFQTVILLIKNAFEGHVLLIHNIRPDELFRKGTLLFKAKPDMMVLSFYEHFTQYKEGLNQMRKILQERDADLTEIRFDLLVHSLIINHLIRFPVSLFSSGDIRSYTCTFLINQQAMDQRFELVLLSERALGEYEFIKKVNIGYAEKFNESVRQLGIKEEAFLHYQRKLALSYSPDINTEEELDDLMYKKLIYEKLYRSPTDINKLISDDPANSVTSNSKLKIREKTKVLYRYVSKSCSEVHSVADSENNFPELNHIFLEANSIYNEPALTSPEAILQYMRLVQLLSKVVIFRKIQGLDIADNLHLISDMKDKEVLSKDDIKSLRRNLEDRLTAYRLKSLTDYKIRFIMDDDLTVIHNNFLKKQIDFIDRQIMQVQNDIREVLKLKSKPSILKTDKNQEN